MFRYLSKKISMGYAFGSEEDGVVRGPSKRMEMLIPSFGGRQG